MARELGSERRETVRSLSIVGVGDKKSVYVTGKKNKKCELLFFEALFLEFGNFINTFAIMF